MRLSMGQIESSERHVMARVLDPYAMTGRTGAPRRRDALQEASGAGDGAGRSHVAVELGESGEQGTDGAVRDVQEEVIEEAMSRIMPRSLLRMLK